MSVKRLLFLALIALVLASCSRGDDEALESDDGRLTVRLLGFTWKGYPAGLELPEVGRIGGDYACVAARIEVVNLTGEPCLLPEGFELGQPKGLEVAKIAVGLTPDRSGAVGSGYAVPAGETVTIHLLSGLQDIVYLEASGDLQIRHQRESWKWAVGRVPEREVLLAKAIEEGCAASLTAILVGSSWERLSAGRTVMEGGQEREISADRAGFEIELEITNNARGPVSFGPPLLLRGNANTSISVLGPSPARYDREEWKELCRDLAPGETRTFAMASRMVVFEELQSHLQLELHHPYCRWRIALDPLPKWDDIPEAGE